VRTAGSTGGAVDPGYFYYSAFTERRVLFESWIVASQGGGEQPYPALYALNSAATLHADPAAVRELARMGVTYILIDKTHGGGGVREPANVSRLVFSNGALDVYRITVPVDPRSC
jgi:hypothetical protein